VGIITSLQSVLGRNTWPPPGVAATWERCELYAALRDSDETRIRQEASRQWVDPYIISPVPRLVSRASANLLFGQPAEFTPANESDADSLEALVNANALDSELVRAALIASSEGAVWGRIVVQPALLDAPIIEWVSPRRVIPHFNGRFPMGATFISEHPQTATEVVRVLETYDPGIISTRAYRGTHSTLGAEISLDSFPATMGIQPDVVTGVDQALIAFIPNTLASDPEIGISDYDGLRDRFLALNEATTIAQQNLKLAGRKRALIDAAYLDTAGRFIDSDDVYIRSDRDEMLGDGGKPVQMIEYGYESQALIAWLDHLLDSTLSYAGIAPQSIGRSVDGGATSGTALRLKMNHSLIEAAGKGRHFDRGLGRLLQFAAILDSRRTTEGGFGRQWADPETAPTIKRHDGLVRDDNEAAQMISTLLNSEGISTDQAVRTLHPDWSPEQVDEEVSRIRDHSPMDAQTPVADPSQISTARPPVTLPPSQ
jgi:hypothetical protein